MIKLKKELYASEEREVTKNPAVSPRQVSYDAPSTLFVTSGNQESDEKNEINLGRKKSSKNAPRVCDIDVLDYDKKVFTSEMNLPHPRMHLRNFVLMPLYEINRDWTHPVTKLHIKSLILSLSNRDITSIKQI